MKKLFLSLNQGMININYTILLLIGEVFQVGIIGDMVIQENGGDMIYQIQR